MGRDQDRDAGQFEWVNAWAETAAKSEPVMAALPADVGVDRINQQADQDEDKVTED